MTDRSIAAKARQLLIESGFDKEQTDAIALVLATKDSILSNLYKW